MSIHRGSFASFCFNLFLLIMLVGTLIQACTYRAQPEEDLNANYQSGYYLEHRLYEDVAIEEPQTQCI